VLSLAAAIDARVVLDVAGNDGHFSRELLRAGAACTVSTDQDALTSELAYIAARAQGAHALHALVCDAELLLRGACSAGSPRPLAQRVGADTAMLLAASHHLAITSGMPYALQARQLASLAPRLIVEYVPPYDRQAVAMLAQRPEPPHPMDRASFIEGFSDAFSLRVQLPIEESDRELFLFERR
jgi:hypothetical protein